MGRGLGGGVKGRRLVGQGLGVQAVTDWQWMGTGYVGGKERAYKKIISIKLQPMHNIDRQQLQDPPTTLFTYTEVNSTRKQIKGADLTRNDPNSFLVQK